MSSPLVSKIEAPTVVTVAHLQSGITVTGQCNSETNFNIAKFPRLKMSVNSTDLVMDFGGGVVALVPRTNVKVMLLG